MVDEKNPTVENATKTTDVPTEESSAKNDAVKAAKAKKGHKKLFVTLGVVVAVIVVAGVGFFAWHEQPSFCNAICHTPMDGYLPTYESEMDEPGIDKWGNEVELSNAMLAPTHRSMNENTCLSCHVPTIGEQIGEAVSWVSGNYEVIETQTGMLVPPEKDLEQLTAARGIPADEFCLNESCHNMTRDDLIEATSEYERNPHKAQHQVNQCSTCHKAHRASVNMCSQCHSDVPIPDGWLTVAESDKLKKALK